MVERDDRGRGRCDVWAELDIDEMEESGDGDSVGSITAGVTSER